MGIISKDESAPSAFRKFSRVNLSFREMTKEADELFVTKLRRIFTLCLPARKYPVKFELPRLSAPRFAGNSRLLNCANPEAEKEAVRQILQLHARHFPKRRFRRRLMEACALGSPSDNFSGRRAPEKGALTECQLGRASKPGANWASSGEAKVRAPQLPKERHDSPKTPGMPKPRFQARFFDDVFRGGLWHSFAGAVFKPPLNV
jgi:hypothetical protein